MMSKFDPADHPNGTATRHLRQRALAARWDLSMRTLERWRSEGRGPPFLKLGGRVCYALDDIIAFETANKRDPQSGEAPDIQPDGLPENEE